ncbi:hypothetical protein SDC9_09101 [bioreactor metagenome]|uniref:Spore coat protein n=1 Tax=bioreactor metagenome TaxID=1076179 RepID=A0A644T955_9ZZZZ|nr:spore coat protein [Negativicutes bacterium]
MSSFMSTIFSKNIQTSMDQVIANNAMAGAAAASSAYLTAALQATTPEVRHLYNEYTSQSAMGHEALTGLALKKGWINPYDDPQQQLQTTLSQSQSIVNTVH